jgi:hypothetical protein
MRDTHLEAIGGFSATWLPPATVKQHTGILQLGRRTTERADRPSIFSD